MGKKFQNKQHPVQIAESQLIKRNQLLKIIILLSNAQNVALPISMPFQTPMERGLVSGNFVVVEYLDYAELEKLKLTTIGHVSPAETNSKCNGR